MANYLNVCYKALYNIYKDGSYSNVEVNKQLSSIKNDKELITKIVYGTVENDIKIEYIIKSLAPKVKDLPVKIVLKMGAYMALDLNIPSYAIVNENVKLIKSLGFTSASGLVNAVLKKIVNKEYKLPSESNLKKYLSINYSKPEWFVDMVIKQYGKDFAKEFFAAKVDTTTTIRVNTSKISEAEFKSLLKNMNIAYKDTFIGNVLAVDYKKLNGEKRLLGLYTVQNIGSIIICDTAEIKNGSKVLDTCAAPGGKTMYIAENNKQGTVEAWDLHEHRVELIEKYRQRMELNNVSVKVKDATVLDKACIKAYDAVLCDVPCSGLGVIYSKPDILISKDIESIETLPELQYNILNTCAEYVALGGSIIYSTCTINKSENEEVVKKFLSEHSDFKLDYNLPKGVEVLDSGFGFTTLPNISGLEGFFVSRMIRV